MAFQFSTKSYDLLKEVHPDLRLVMVAALTRSPIDFGITDGLRTKERQLELVKLGQSKTLNSRHLTGHAVDIAVYIRGKVSWDLEYYSAVANIVLSTAKDLKIPVIWGGSWETFKDGPHFELDRKRYK